MRAESKVIKSQNADLLLINQISKPTRIADLQIATNMNQLHSLLKMKNTKSGCSKQQIQNAQSWLNRQGIDISPLQQKLVKAKDINMQKQKLKQIQEDCLFYIPDMSAGKINQYLVKAHQYATLNIIQSSMKRSDISSMIINKAKNKHHRSGLNYGNKQNLVGVITQINTQTRDEQKRQKYLKCITKMANQSIQRQQLPNLISKQINSKMWKIFDRHVKAIKQHTHIDYKQRLCALYIQSLKLVQQSYSSELPHDINGLNNYLSEKYIYKLQKREEKYLRDREHLAFWGKAFLLYRAGRLTDFYNLLSTRNQTLLMRQFKTVEQAISKLAPVASDKRFDQMEGIDVFKDQLIYALKGESKYSSQVLSDPCSLDLIWIILRNLGIYYQRVDDQFQQYKNKVLQFYSKQQHPLTTTQIYNYFYLAAYDQIAQRGVSCVMDQDDYVHFLICLNDHSNLIGNKDQSRIQRLLTKQLVLYIQELISLGRKQYVYYTALIPKVDKVQQISTILSSSNFVSTYNWEYLKKSVGSFEQFSKIVQKTLSKQISITNDYLIAAEKYVQLLNDKNKAVKCLIQLLIKSFYGDHHEKQIAQQAQVAIDRYLYKNQELQQKYRDFLRFLIQCRKLSKLIYEKKDGQVYHLVKNSEFIVLGSIVPEKLYQLFDNLIEHSGLGIQIYFKFLVYVIRGLQNSHLKDKNILELKNFVGLIQENITLILSNEKYQVFRNRNQSVELQNLMNEVSYQVLRY